MNAKIFQIAYSDFTQVMPFLQEALIEGGGHEDWGIDDIYEQYVSGEVLVWAFTNHIGLFGAGVSTVYDYPKRRVVEILLMSSDPGYELDWLDCLDQFKEYAKSVGASSITGTGRVGWARKLKCRERRVFELPVQSSRGPEKNCHKDCNRRSGISDEEGCQCRSSNTDNLQWFDNHR